MNYLRFSPIGLAALAVTASLGYASVAQAAIPQSSVEAAPESVTSAPSAPKPSAKLTPKASAAHPDPRPIGSIAAPQSSPEATTTLGAPEVKPSLEVQLLSAASSLQIAQGVSDDSSNQIKISPTAPPPSSTPPTSIEGIPPSTPVETPKPSEAPALPTSPTTPGTTPTAPGSSETTTAPEPRVLVSEVDVKGATGNLEDEVYRVIRTRPGQTTTRSQLQEDINAIFATGYFANVQATPEDTPLGVRVTFDVQPNPTLKTVQLEGSSLIPQAEVDKVFQDQYGSTLNYRRLQEGIQTLTKRYQDQGYVLAQVVDLPKVAPDGTVTLQVAEGDVEAVRVRFLNKDGQEQVDKNGKPKGHTRDFIILREMQTKAGQVFNRKIAEQDLQRVYGLGIFEDVKLSLDPGTDPRKAIVNVNIVERNTGSIALGAGISSASGLFGTVSYQQQNLGGNNQKLGAEVQVGQRELLFDANFSDPWIAGDPHHTSYAVNVFRRSSISLIFSGGSGNDIQIPNGGNYDEPRVVRTGGSLTFSRPLSKDLFKRSPWSASLGLQYQHVQIQDATGNVIGTGTTLVNTNKGNTPLPVDGSIFSYTGTGNDDLLTLQFGIVRDLRNDPLRPTSGSLLRLGTEQSVPIGQGSILFNRVRASYSFYIPTRLTKFTPGCRQKDAKATDCPQAFAFNIQGGTVFGDLPPYEAFSLGGSNSVRGYDEGTLGSGKSYLQASAEYRFPLFSIISGALFFDAATDLGTGSQVKGNPAALQGEPGSGFGYGIGVRVQSPLGPIRVDYGLNDLGQSRISFGIGERF